MPPGRADLNAGRAGRQESRPHTEAEPVDRKSLGDPLKPLREDGDWVEDARDRDQTDDWQRDVAHVTGAGDQRSEYGADGLGRHESQEQHPYQREPGTDIADVQPFDDEKAGNQEDRQVRQDGSRDGSELADEVAAYAVRGGF